MNPAARTLEALDWPFVLEALANHARTAAGRRAASEVAWLTEPSAVEASFDVIQEVQALLERKAGAPPVGGIEEIDAILVGSARGEVLDQSEVRGVSATLTSLAHLQEFLHHHRSVAPTLAQLGAAIDLDPRLRRAFETALDEHGQLSEVTWPQLGELRRRIASLERNMRTTLERLLESPEYAELLQDRYVTVRGDRFVLPIKAQAKSLGLGIVHDASRSERTVFVEPAAVVPLGNQRRMAEAELKEEERRILTDLSAQLGRHANGLQEALRAAAALDVACARSDFALRLGATRPTVQRGDVIDLKHARHPVLALTSDAVVANSFRLDPQQAVLVLTGPNAGGKTVAMKTIGLCALLVRAGCFVPAAAGSRVDVFDPIVADIGDMQTLQGGLSSFSAHLTALREMLENAGHGSLLLLDEIAAGTDPSQGGALARAVVERLADVGARVVATTHYSQVKAMGSDDSRVAVAALEYDGGRPTYRVVAGSIGESHALSAAARVGIDEALIARAKALMDEGEQALHDTLAALDQERTRTAELARDAEEARGALLLQQQNLDARDRALAAREESIRGRAKELEQRAAAALVDKLRAAEDDVKRTLAALHKAPSRELGEQTRAAIRDARGVAKDVGRQEAVAPSRPLKVGDRVRVVGLGLSGEVLALRTGEVEIQSGMMTVRARPDEVELVSGSNKSPARPRTPRKASTDSAPPDWLDSAMRSPTNTLDLRGVRVEDGIARLESFLDESMLESREVVFVLHGHGTGAMKQAVRRVLADSPYVSASGPAAEDQGGDALTVSRLRG